MASSTRSPKSEAPPRGYFAVGVEGINKAHNLGNLIRTAHAFGAQFFFTVNDTVKLGEVEQADTSAASGHLPLYRYKNWDEAQLPVDCALVGVELTDDAVDLPSFRHPLRAAYLLGPELGSLSSEAQGKCAHIVKIPARFCVNVGVAGAIAMYDRMVSLGRYAERPVGSAAKRRD